MQGDAGSEDEGRGGHGGKGSASVAKTKNEVLEDHVAKPEVVITSDMTLQELGVVQSLVENLVLVKAKISGEYQVLETGSVLCLADRSVVGSVAEPLGRVQQPMYSVRFNNRDEMAQAGIEVGTTLYYVDQYATYVFTQPLKALKGSDASNLYDEEVAHEEMEFSDDEAEAEYKRRVKQDRQARRGGRMGTNGGRPRLSQPDTTAHGLSYDDHDDEAITETTQGEDDGLYTPLARPSNFQDLIRAPDTPLEARSSRDPAQRGGHGGRGRAHSRGRARDARGARGRDSRGSRGDRGALRVGPANARSSPHDMHRSQIQARDLPVQAEQHRHAPESAFYHPPSPQPSAYAPARPTTNVYNQQHAAPPEWPQGSPAMSSGWSPHGPPPASLPRVPPPPFSSYFPTPPPASPGGTLPAGAFVNPAFFRGPAQPSTGQNHWDGGGPAPLGQWNQSPSPGPGQWNAPSLHMQGPWSGPSMPAAGQWSPPGHATAQSPGTATLSPNSDAAFRAAQEKLNILRGLTGNRPR